nr:unnamed protein product [Callosobruchus analis]
MYDWRRPVKLHELLEELEHPDGIPVAPDGVILFPPENANDNVTDCDSGDEEFTTMNNLPGSQLRNDVEIIRDVHENLYDSDDEIPLSQLYPRGSTSTVEAPGHPAPKKSKIRSWTVEDISHTPVVEWNSTRYAILELFRIRHRPHNSSYLYGPRRNSASA